MILLVNRFIILLLLVLQSFAPLVHAHVHIIDSDEGIHIHGITTPISHEHQVSALDSVSCTNTALCISNRHLLKKWGKLTLEVKTMPNSIFNKDPEILSGTQVFTGTRVPIRILFEHLDVGDSLAVFLDNFPTVTQDQATALLDLAMKQIIESDEVSA